MTRNNKEKATRSHFSICPVILFMKKVWRINGVTVCSNIFICLLKSISKTPLEPKPAYPHANTPLLQHFLLWIPRSQNTLELPQLAAAHCSHSCTTTAPSLCQNKCLWAYTANYQRKMIRVKKKIKMNGFGANAWNHKLMQWFKPEWEKESKCELWSSDESKCLGGLKSLAWIGSSMALKPALLPRKSHVSRICISLALTLLWCCHYWNLLNLPHQNNFCLASTT